MYSKTVFSQFPEVTVAHSVYVILGINAYDLEKFCCKSALKMKRHLESHPFKSCVLLSNITLSFSLD